MVRGGVCKTDTDEIYGLFHLTSPTWVSTPEAESRRERIFRNEWDSLAEGTKRAYRSALRAFLKYVSEKRRDDPGFTGLQDSDVKVAYYLHWLLDEVEGHNKNVEQKMRKAPLQQVEHAIQALSCVKKCQMGVDDQSNGWRSSNSEIKGPVNRAKKLQAAVQASAVCSSGLNNKILTAREYAAYISEGYTHRTTPEHAVTGMRMVVEATTATNCGLRAEDSGELRWSLMAVADRIEGVGPAPMVPLQLGLRRAESKVSRAGRPEWFAVVENVNAEQCPVLAVACLLVLIQPRYQQAFLHGDMQFWEHRLLAQGAEKAQPVPYYKLHAEHSKVMTAVGLADDKSGTALHIFRSTGDAMLRRAGVPKAQIDEWGRWDQSTEHVFYAVKEPLHTLQQQAVLGGWGAGYQKEYYLGRSTVPLKPSLLEEFTAMLRPDLAAAQQKVDELLEEVNALPAAKKQFASNREKRTLLTDMRQSLAAERRLIQVFLYGLPLLVDTYGTEKLVVVRGSPRVANLLADSRYQEYVDIVRAAHQEALRRIELAKLPLEDRMLQAMKEFARATAAPSPPKKRKLAAEEPSPAVLPPAALPSPQPISASATAPAAAPAPPVPAPPASITACGRTGIIEFNKRFVKVREAFEEWPSIEARVSEVGGLQRCTKDSRNLFNKNRHLVQRMRLVMQEHGLGEQAVCDMYQRVMDKFGFTLRELRDAVNHAEPVPDANRRGGRTADRSDSSRMSRGKGKPAVTRKEILACVADSLQEAFVTRKAGMSAFGNIVNT